MQSRSVSGSRFLVLACGALFTLTVAARPPADTQASVPTAEASAARRPLPTIYPLVVSFNSLGEGISYGHYASFRTQLAEFEANWGGQIEQQIVNWGREGEFDVCLTAFDPPETYWQNFVYHLRENLEPSGRVVVTEQDICGQ